METGFKQSIRFLTDGCDIDQSIATRRSRRSAIRC